MSPHCKARASPILSPVLAKESTLKSYLQKDLLPGPLKRLKTDKGAISVYPADTMRHLNFVRYCLFSGNSFVNVVMNIIKEASVSDEDHLRAASEEIDPSGMDGDDCFHSVYIGIDRLETGLAWLDESIEKAFAEYPAKRKEYLGEKKDLERIKEQFEAVLAAFLKKLRAAKTPVHLKPSTPAAEKGEEEGEA